MDVPKGRSLLLTKLLPIPVIADLMQENIDVVLSSFPMFGWVLECVIKDDEMDLVEESESSVLIGITVQVLALLIDGDDSGVEMCCSMLVDLIVCLFLLLLSIILMEDDIGVKG